MVQSPNWVLSQGILTSRVQFTCRECEKITMRAKLVSAAWADHPGTRIALAQCQWCGMFNSFFKNGRPLIYS